ncbi:hypothetical protein SARC_00267 [Sphaeroforma arctica JP610]|uniref:Uncharacterized protein n=1 Tax=Sphaeroforma arctica JP610 TaxID=667725 RepID=A0A0L0GF71_9EUKA|nr:hypothetical protein SARC_00267 [Sphaeroforma arctica JP610]KNC87637.1 hypothetical protein SARC_00267 [Sphaeroforma arctica JP610]|eukprot:XP_014161539.1 hypothetical protein SARC_00267 [Sphaeroforma arctica JP610]
MGNAAWVGTGQEEDDDGVLVTKCDVVRHIVYGDQILEGENKQDSSCVYSMVEAYLYAIKERLPRMTATILASDDAGCYKSKELLLYLVLLNLTCSIQIVRFIHTETQDGKGLLDAHFARGGGHVNNFMKSSKRNRIKKIATPKDLAAALAWKGGIQNAFVQLIAIDRKGRLQTFIEQTKKIVDAAGKFFTRANDVIFERATCPLVGGDLLDLGKILNSDTVIHLRAYAYSGVGTGVLFPDGFSVESFTIVDEIDADVGEGVDLGLANSIIDKKGANNGISSSATGNDEDTAAKPRKQWNFNAKRAPLSEESLQEEDDSDGEMVMSGEVDYVMETEGDQVEPDDLN